MCPLACKQKAQPKRTGAPEAARWPQRCARPGLGLRRWGLSSRRPPPLVAPGSCSSGAARRGFAGSEPCCIPSCIAARPRGPVPLGPGASLEPAAGARGRRAAAERGEVAGREAGCSTAGLSAGEELWLPFVSKSKHCPLLSRPRQRARHTGSHTSGSSRVLGVFREGTGRAEPPLGKFPRLLFTQGARGGPQGARLAAEAATPPPPPSGRGKNGQPGNPVSPLVAEDAVGRAGCGLPAPSRRGGDSGRPPAGPGRGTFPAWSQAKKTRSGAEGAEGCDLPEGNTRGVQFGDRGERQSAWGEGAREIREVWGCPGDRGEITPPAAGSQPPGGFGDGELGGGLWRGGGEWAALGGGRICKLRGQRRV